MIKIHGEHTRPSDAPTLCESCSRALIVRGSRFGDDFVSCAAVEPPLLIRFTVTDCTAYDDKRIPGKHVYFTTGWQWMPDIGEFLSPNEKYRREVAHAQRNVKPTPAPLPPLWRRLWSALRGRD